MSWSVSSANALRWNAPDPTMVSFGRTVAPSPSEVTEFYAITLARKGRGALFKQRVLDQVPEDWLAFPARAGGGCSGTWRSSMTRRTSTQPR
ncbi:MAG: hypothetical protein R2864_05545 [Syntrophotaleaceae bacterium]